MKYRKKIDLVADILNVAINNSKKTRIMYSGNLSFVLLNNYLELLTKADLLRFNSTNRLYSTTEKGEKFLKVYNDYKNNMQTSTRVLEILEGKKNQLEQMFS